MELSFEDTSSSFNLIFRVSLVNSPRIVKQWPSLKPIAISESFSTSSTVTETCGLSIESWGVLGLSLMLRMQVPMGVLRCSLASPSEPSTPKSEGWKRLSSLTGVRADSLIRQTFNTGNKSSLSVPIVTRCSLELLADGWAGAPVLFPRLTIEEQCVTATL